MDESMSGMKRTHYCGEVTEALLGQTVTVMGWVNKRRYLSQLIFIVVRDRTGLIQVTVDETKVPEERWLKAKAIRGEYVVAATGVVIARTPENINPNMPTGQVEIDVTELRVLSEADVPPFQVADTDVSNDLRLKYRYIDLRRPAAQEILLTRHRISQSARQFLSADGFIEVETPVLTKSSPEGARDYLVASRTYPGQFYALPQSPQMFKQILMISGLDKYFQIAKCYRDEDLRADRQPEFTQIDMEMSFVDREDVISLTERMMLQICRDALDVTVTLPFERMTWREAMNRFGSDKPDLRFGMELTDISSLVQDSGFAVFQNALDQGGSIRGIVAEGCAATPRKQIDAWVELAKEYKAKGLAWITLTENGEIKTTLSKFLAPETLSAIIGAMGGKPGDLLLICADKDAVVFDALGALRIAVAKKLGLTDPKTYRFVWITDFPLLEWSEEDGRYYAAHHPFTAPMDEDLPLLETDPGAVRAKAYDLVLNGFELGGGSIRIYQRDLQDRMFKTLGFSPEDAQKGFGFFLEALKYGTPPHGGVALGLDRMTMLFTGAESLRDVIAFPKVKDASCPMTDAPSEVDTKQLNELGIAVNSAHNIE